MLGASPEHPLTASAGNCLAFENFPAAFRNPGTDQLEKREEERDRVGRRQQRKV